MGLSRTGVLWSGFAHEVAPLSHQGRLVGTYERHDYGMLPGPSPHKFLLTTFS
jgi:hypothetical protein